LKKRIDKKNKREHKKDALSQLRRQGEGDFRRYKSRKRSIFPEAAVYIPRKGVESLIRGGREERAGKGKNVREFMQNEKNRSGTLH